MSVMRKIRASGGCRHGFNGKRFTAIQYADMIKF